MHLPVKMEILELMGGGAKKQDSVAMQGSFLKEVQIGRGQDHYAGRYKTYFM